MVNATIASRNGRLLAAVALAVGLVGCGGGGGSMVPPVSPPTGVRVACVGDSITAGDTIRPLHGRSYPDALQGLLGSGYVVGNLDSGFGHSGATAVKSGDKPYWNTAEFTSSTAFGANDVVILLGANDSKPFNWALGGPNFKRDYGDLVVHYQQLPSHPVVYVCLCLPVMADGAYGISSSTVENEINPDIVAVAALTGVTVIDTHAPFVGHPEYFSDGIHPNADGARILALAVGRAVVAPPQ